MGFSTPGPDTKTLEPFVDDEEKENPDIVDVLLTRELLGLSVEDRNSFQEEIHGVTCLAREETSALLQESLRKLQQEIDMLPDNSKQAYLKSQSLVDEDTNPPRATYVNTDDFRLRFLRFELFDAPRTAVRMADFLDLILELFGEYALLRPIRLSDFSKTELRHLRKGKYQFLPYRDRGGTCGRRIFCAFPDSEWEDIPPLTRNKMTIYLTWVAGNDVNTQREGIVFVIWFDPNANYSKKFPNHLKDHRSITVRASAIHSCSSDTPIHRFRRAVFSMRIGHNRSRLKQHVGEPVELRYALQSYGIPAEQIPITYTGKVKLTYFRQWLRSREFIENYDVDRQIESIDQECGNDIRNPSSTSVTRGLATDNTMINEHDARDTIIESPYLNDIIFRKGANTSHYPGNAAMTRLIEIKTRRELQTQHEQQFMSHEDRSNNKADIKITSKRTKTKLFVSEVINEIREKNFGEEKKCRFLAWDERGWWMELSNNEIRSRIEYIARGIRNSVTKSYRSSTVLAEPPSAAESTSAYEAGNGSKPVHLRGLRDGDNGWHENQQKKMRVTSQSIGNDNESMIWETFSFCQPRYL
mmetsp:Transcript_13266/g.30981  ORF Transcript_13266/g.30981 Transcript_13266/m.30981 type:complete len:584 (-) Transcript_13266:930-2681(-)